MAASLNDSYQLSQYTPFQQRVQMAMIAWCVQANSEAWTVPFHRERQQWAAQVLSNPTSYVPAYSMIAADNATVIGDATQAGTVALTSANLAAQSALVTDADLNNAIFAGANSFFRCPDDALASKVTDT